MIIPGVLSGPLDGITLDYVEAADATGEGGFTLQREDQDSDARST